MRIPDCIRNIQYEKEDKQDWHRPGNFQLNAKKRTDGVDDQFTLEVLCQSWEWEHYWIESIPIVKFDNQDLFGSNLVRIN